MRPLWPDASLSEFRRVNQVFAQALSSIARLHAREGGFGSFAVLARFADCLLDEQHAAADGERDR